MMNAMNRLYKNEIKKGVKPKDLTYQPVKNEKGIIIGFQSRLDVYALVIPYYKLVLFKPGNSITFHIDQHYISVDCSKNSKGVQKFINKVELEKEKNTYYSPLDVY